MINKPHKSEAVMVQKQVSFGAGPLASKDTPLEVNPVSEMK